MPPPPPPPPMRPPPSGPQNSLKSNSGPSDKGALLKDIRGGVRLKKAVTVDKSGPYIPGKVSNNNNNNNVSKPTMSNRSPPSTSAAPISNGGINFDDILNISLRKTGKRPGGNTEPDSVGRPKDLYPRNNGASQIQDALRKQVPPRGPPPQPPASPMFSQTKPVVSENKPVVNRLATSKLSQMSIKKRDNTVDSAISSPTQNIPNAIPNSSSLHGNNNSSNSSPFVGPKPVTSHGKPNLAPKPPGVKPAPPPKNNNLNGRLSVNRTQSMRVPRSPGTQPQSPQFTLPINGNEFANTLRNTSTLHQSNEALNRRNITPTKNTTLTQHLSRPTQPPPLRPPQSKPPPPPPFRLPSSIQVPQSPPPPPPPLAVTPRVAPPPPLHARVAPPPPTHSSRFNAVPPPPPPPNLGGGVPPVPPIRGSSMTQRNGGQTTPQQEFDSRFIFHSLTVFPAPDIFRRFPKEYNGVQGSKQQAPLPPSATLQLGDKLWPSGDSSTC